MAFQQPTRQLPQRLVRPEPQDQDRPAVATAHVQAPVDSSQTWVLFSPATDASASTSYLTESAQDEQPTPGRSRISDLGSLGTVTRSDAASISPASILPDLGLPAAAEEDAELDSLDSHLPDFRTVPNPYSRNGHPAIVAPLLPAHDGLGSFRLDAHAITSPEAQNQLYAFERFNPHRVMKRQESLDLGQAALENGDVTEAERNTRIEAWRMEQSRLVLNEIRNETRRRRQSLASASSKRKPQSSEATVPAATAATGSVDGAAHDIGVTSNDWHEHEAPKLGKARDGLWTRITRRVIRDLMGIDDGLLAILFGEALPGQDAELAALPKEATQDSASADSFWQISMLERIARELGALLNRMSTHPGAFSAYSRIHQIALPYAGLPVIPESATDAAADEDGDGDVAHDGETASSPQFRPTILALAHVGDTVLAKMPSEGLAGASEMGPSGKTNQAFTQREWERELDVKLVFRYLRSRFTSSSRAGLYESGPSHLATASQDAALKAARVRQHHPLIMSPHHHHHHYSHSLPRPARPPLDRVAFKASAGTGSAAVAAALRHHGPGSCASSTRRSHTRRSSASSRPSSRHFWDIGCGSTGTSSMIASAGPTGSWGDV